MRGRSLLGLTVLLIAILITVIFIQESVTKGETLGNFKAVDLSNFSTMRVENEDKLDVPPELVEEVWQYLVDRYVNDKEYLKSLDANLDSYWYDELFTDVYFDTPDLTMLNRKSGIRHRTRVNLTDPDDRKHGRELMQVKINNIDANIMNRGEIKFKIEHPVQIISYDDAHSAIGIVKNSSREQFKQVVSDLGMNPFALKKILVNKQRRRSLYIPRNGQQFISIRLDECSSDMFLAKWRHVELEPELNELPYTQADSTEKAFMESINRRIVDDILQKFPEIKRDLTPKYNKAFNYFESKIPFLRVLIRTDII